MMVSWGHLESSHVYIYIYGPVSRVPTPPHGMGGVWCPCGGVYTYIHAYMHTLPLHYLTLPYLTLHYHTYIHTCIHAYMHTCIPYIPTYQHTNIPTYQHTNIPTYQHTTTTGHRGEDQKNHTTTTGHRGGGPEEPYHHHRPQGGDQKNHTTTTGHRGGGPEEPDDTVHPYPLVGGGEGGWPTLHHIYIYIFNIHVIIHIWKAFIPLHQKNMSVLGNIINSHPPTQLIIKFLLAIFISISVWLDHVTPYFWW